jgi:hypothetical protein
MTQHLRDGAAASVNLTRQNLQFNHHYQFENQAWHSNDAEPDLLQEGGTVSKVVANSVRLALSAAPLS